MAKVELLTVSSALQLFSLRGVYMLGYSWLFGMCKSRYVRRIHEDCVSLTLPRIS